MLNPRSCQPTDLSYKYDSRHNTKFVAARLWRCTGKDAFLRDLATTLNTAKASKYVMILCQTLLPIMKFN